MMTWTCNNFKGHYPVGTSLVVSAETVDMAIILCERELEAIGLKQTIKRYQMIPFPTHHRYCRILQTGDY